ncbi:MAG: acetate/propionate family kinase [Nocardioides sp.]|nr:acetate/propionate family kinase [Nocardioides sp.]
MTRETEDGVRSLLVLNCGSSSLKYDVFTWPQGPDAKPARVSTGVVKEIGRPEAPDHEAALRVALEQLRDEGPGLDALAAVAHRVVHGGPDLSDPVVVDERVLRMIEEAAVLAPLHNPPALAGIRAVRDRWPEVPQVAVFDTAFHRTLPPAASTYALPHDLAEQHHVRRWGFHGISHEYVTRTSAAALGLPTDEARLVICHIGNGVSVTAVRAGRSIDTSMGFTPMDGAVMGTRTGSLDPGAVFHLARRTGLSLDELEDVLLHESGMRGLCGDSDLQRVRERADAGDAEAVAALAVYTHRLRAFVASYLGQLPGLHAVVFTAGVGEHDPALRAEVIGPLAHLGLELDEAANRAVVGAQGGPARIDTGRGPAVLVVPTDEGAEVARQAQSVLRGQSC